MDKVKEVIDIASSSTSSSTSVKEIIDVKSDKEPLSDNEKLLRTKIEYSEAFTELLKTLSVDGSVECCGGQFFREILDKLMKLILDIEKQLLVDF